MQAKEGPSHRDKWEKRRSEYLLRGSQGISVKQRALKALGESNLLERGGVRGAVEQELMRTHVMEEGSLQRLVEAGN